MFKPPPKANVEMTPSSASTTQSVVGDQESEDASSDSVEVSDPAKWNTFVQGPSRGEASPGGIVTPILVLGPLENDFKKIDGNYHFFKNFFSFHAGIQKTSCL